MKAIFREIFANDTYSVFMLCLIYLYAVTKVPFQDLSDVFRGLFLLGSIPILFLERRKIFRDPMMVLLGISIAVQVLSWINSTIHLPDIAYRVPQIDRMAKLFSFVFIAYWLKGSLRNTFLLWSCFMLGFIVGCGTKVDFFIEMERAFNGHRVDFAIKNAQFTSMFAGVSLLLSIFFLSQSWRKRAPFDRISGLQRKAIVLLCVVATSIFGFLVIVTQSRQVWLALLITAILVPLFYASTQKVNLKKIALAYAAILMVGIVVLQSDIVSNRISVESATMRSIISGDLDNIPLGIKDSIGVRVHSWLVSSAWISERPILGSGPKAIEQVITQSDKFKVAWKELGHLHNFHIEILVAYGFLGLAVIYAMYFWLIRSVFKARYNTEASSDLVIFAFAYLSFWVVINFFETISGRSYGVFTHNVMFAGFYTFYLTNALANRES